jgi:predicted nuclease of predicted toxin-antitoxin system
MRLLIDENLSPRLAAALSDAFPGSIHVRDVGLKGAQDQRIWGFAAEHGYAILSKDDDFRSLSLLRGAPPKVIWLVIGNTSTTEILAILLRHSLTIQSFLDAAGTSLLTLRKTPA